MPKLQLVAGDPDRSKKSEWLKSRAKYVTGFCNDINKPAQCEGTKPKGHNGSPMMTCEYIDSCPCDCHYRLDEMFEMTGHERKLITNPDYKTPVSEFIIPTAAMVAEDTRAPVPIRSNTPALVEQPGDGLATPVPATLATRRTPTGRTARGGLEYQVHEAVTFLAIMDPLTPKIVSEYIAKKYTIPPPSSGAIRAVWMRWERDDYATIGQKPLRFVKFNGDASYEAREKMIQSQANAAKSASAAVRTGRARLAGG